MLYMVNMCTCKSICVFCECVYIVHIFYTCFRGKAFQWQSVLTKTKKNKRKQMKKWEIFVVTIFVVRSEIQVSKYLRYELTFRCKIKFRTGKKSLQRSVKYIKDTQRCNANLEVVYVKLLQDPVLPCVTEDPLFLSVISVSTSSHS